MAIKLMPDANDHFENDNRCLNKTKNQMFEYLREVGHCTTKCIQRNIFLEWWNWRKEI